MLKRVQSGICSVPVAVSRHARRVRTSLSGPRPRRDGLTGSSSPSSSSGSLVSSLVVLRVLGVFVFLVVLGAVGGGLGSAGPASVSLLPLGSSP